MAALPILISAPTPWQVVPGAGFTLKMAAPAPALLAKRLANGKYRLDDAGELEKHCVHCKEYWPADTEFFYPTPMDDDGLHRWCKACYQEWRSSRRARSAS